MSHIDDIRKYRTGRTVFHRRTGDRGVLEGTALIRHNAKTVLVARVKWNQPSKLNSSENFPVSALLLEHP